LGQLLYDILYYITAFAFVELEDVLISTTLYCVIVMCHKMKICS